MQIHTAQVGISIHAATCLESFPIQSRARGHNLVSPEQHKVPPSFPSLCSAVRGTQVLEEGPGTFMDQAVDCDLGRGEGVGGRQEEETGRGCSGVRRRLW